MVLVAVSSAAVYVSSSTSGASGAVCIPNGPCHVMLMHVKRAMSEPNFGFNVSKAYTLKTNNSLGAYFCCAQGGGGVI